MPHIRQLQSDAGIDSQVKVQMFFKMSPLRSKVIFAPKCISEQGAAFRVLRASKSGVRVRGCGLGGESSAAYGRHGWPPVAGKSRAASLAACYGNYGLITSAAYEYMGLVPRRDECEVLGQASGFGFVGS